MEEGDVKKMEEYVDSCRRGSSSPSFADEDRIESGMRVPISVLIGCNNSFTSADEKRQKCSQHFFVDTGTTGLLCRHDRPLWVLNMTSPGEKQYYAVALIRRLFDHLPSTWRVGLLYDIGCQLHRSFEKWGFLPEYKDRITFGISVFHAYGHQWPCQIIYHPRKCEGFGLTDGEGCERFWSALKKLIPGLRVSGVGHILCYIYFTLQLTCLLSKYHQRIFTLDNQIQFLNTKSLENFGQWLFRRWFYLHEKKQEAAMKLEEINIQSSVLRAEWKNQIQEQTKPVPRTCSLASFARIIKWIFQVNRELRDSVLLKPSLCCERPLN